MQQTRKLQPCSTLLSSDHQQTGTAVRAFCHQAMVTGHATRLNVQRSGRSLCPACSSRPLHLRTQPAHQLCFPERSTIPGRFRRGQHDRPRPQLLGSYPPHLSQEWFVHGSIESIESTQDQDHAPRLCTVHPTATAEYMYVRARTSAASRWLDCWRRCCMLLRVASRSGLLRCGCQQLLVGSVGRSGLRARA